MECILLASNYPNLTKIKLFNFKKEFILHYFANESPLQHIFQQQITDLILDNLPNMKYFSLKCDIQFSLHDTNFLPLFRRMSNLEKLTLYLRIENRDRFVDGTFLQNEILVYMPQLHSFTFYICTFINTIGLLHHLSCEDVQRTFTNIGQQHVASIINYISSEEMTCSVFSIPFTFDCLKDIGHTIPNIIFNYVTYLMVQDMISFNREFFIQVARAFPLLKTFRILNMESQSCQLTNSQLDEIAEYPHLTYLDILYGNIDYLEQFLNETKTYAPCLTKLKVVYNNLRIVTNNFTRDETRRNCAKIKQLRIFCTEQQYACDRVNSRRYLKQHGADSDITDILKTGQAYLNLPNDDKRKLYLNIDKAK
ncbi:unnamed protein product [Adineta steineri]|uniref:Uncharacterized protein n=2 Tax=Adineta steineri TaxID=433720 RepID=A0A819KD88_9BILA|nr:unnamed protein product [Adineta steineri]